MSKVVIVTDSTADFPIGAIAKLGITVVPDYVIIANKSYRDGTELMRADFTEKIQNNPIRKLYGTSQASPYDFAEVYNRLKEKTGSIISLHPPADLSGIYNSACLARKDIKGIDITVIDSSSVSLGLGMLVVEAARMAKDGVDSKDIIRKIEELKSKVYVYALVSDLAWIRQGRGASIDRLGLLIGSVIGLKIVISLHNGELIRAPGVIGHRTRNGGLDNLVKIFQGLNDGGKGISKRIRRAGVIYTPGTTDAEDMANWLRLECPDLEIPVIPTGPALTVQTGLNVVAFAVLTK